MSGPRVLAIETSCDETGVAVVSGGRRIAANQVATQIAVHAATGGIVPEVAARQQLRWIAPTLDAAMAEAKVDWDDLDAVAVTYGPGLIGSLLVGVNVAKALAVVHDLPLVAINHIEGHIYANWLTDVDVGDPLPDEPPFPLLCLVVSGGHTQLVLMDGHGQYRLLGQTVDDAAGEAFDKVGRMLGLPYPGGPAISEAVEDATAVTRFPRVRIAGPMIMSGYLDEYGNTGTVFSPDRNAITSGVLKVRAKIDRSPFPKAELHYTEWSASYTPADPLSPARALSRSSGGAK